MRVIPKGLVEMLWFFANRVDVWAEDPTAIGLDGPTVASVEQAVLAMEAAREEAARARLAAEQASQRYHVRADELRSVGGYAVGRVKAHARTHGGKAVYAAARIPVPAKGGKGAAPGTPERFAVRLVGDGPLEISWACDNGRARGVFYEVQRSIDGGPLEFLGSVGEKKYVDKALPRGTGRATYRVAAARVAGRAGHAGSALVRGPGVSHVVVIGEQDDRKARAAA